MECGLLDTENTEECEKLRTVAEETGDRTGLLSPYKVLNVKVSNRIKETEVANATELKVCLLNGSVMILMI